MPSRAERARPTPLVGQRAVQQAGRLLQERVGKSRRPSSPLPQILLREIQPAQLPVRHAEAVMEARRPRIDRQRPFQVGNGPRRVLAHERRAPDPSQDRGRRRLHGQRPVEHPLGLRRLSLIEMHLAQPDQRRQVVGLQVQDPPETLHRPFPLPGRLVEMGQVVRPADRTGNPRLRVQVGVLRRLVEPGSLQQQAELAVGVAERLRRSAPAAGQRQHRRVPRVDLILHARLQPRQPGQDQRWGRRVLGGGASLRARTCFVERRTGCEHHHRQHGGSGHGRHDGAGRGIHGRRPSPSVSVV